MSYLIMQMIELRHSVSFLIAEESCLSSFVSYNLQIIWNSRHFIEFKSAVYFISHPWISRLPLKLLKEMGIKAYIQVVRSNKMRWIPFTNIVSIYSLLIKYKENMIYQRNKCGNKNCNDWSLSNYLRTQLKEWRAYF